MLGRGNLSDSHEAPSDNVIARLAHLLHAGRGNHKANLEPQRRKGRCTPQIPVHYPLENLKAFGLKTKMHLIFFSNFAPTSDRLEVAVCAVPKSSLV